MFTLGFLNARTRQWNKDSGCQICIIFAIIIKSSIQCMISVSLWTVSPQHHWFSLLIFSQQAETQFSKALLAKKTLLSHLPTINHHLCEASDPAQLWQRLKVFTWNIKLLKLSVSVLAQWKCLVEIEPRTTLENFLECSWWGWPNRMGEREKSSGVKINNNLLCVYFTQLPNRKDYCTVTVTVSFVLKKMLPDMTPSFFQNEVFITLVSFDS